MSLVGTRPILPDELEQYELHHRARIGLCRGYLLYSFFEQRAGKQKKH